MSLRFFFPIPYSPSLLLLCLPLFPLTFAASFSATSPTLQPLISHCFSYFPSPQFHSLAIFSYSLFSLISPILNHPFPFTTYTPDPLIFYFFPYFVTPPISPYSSSSPPLISLNLLIYPLLTSSTSFILIFLHFSSWENITTVGRNEECEIRY